MPPRSDKTRDNNPNWRGGNPYLPYIKQLMEYKRREDIGMISQPVGNGHILVETYYVAEDREEADKYELHIEKAICEFREAHNPNFCTKPHNNGEDTCLECEVIKKGV